MAMLESCNVKKTQWHRMVFAGILLATAVTTSCGDRLPTELPPVDDPEAFVIQGKVSFVQVEGGCWAINATDGVRYEPLGLLPAFQDDGLEIQAAVKYRDDLATACMVGRNVEILAIAAR